PLPPFSFDRAVRRPARRPGRGRRHRRARPLGSPIPQGSGSRGSCFQVHSRESRRSAVVRRALQGELAQRGGDRKARRDPGLDPGHRECRPRWGRSPRRPLPARA
ncbi:hypothetical protein OY671_012533, partial [Metschnikowia pulcherrima]